MTLTPGKLSNALFKLALAGMLILAGILLTGSRVQVYATSCGTDYHGNYTCQNGGHDWIQCSYPPCAPSYCQVQPTLDLVYIYDNPLSFGYGGSGGVGPVVCEHLISNNCPAYCN